MSTTRPKITFHLGPNAVGSAQGGEWRWTHAPRTATEYEIETAKAILPDGEVKHRAICRVPAEARRMPWADEARFCRVRAVAPDSGPWTNWIGAE